VAVDGVEGRAVNAVVEAERRIISAADKSTLIKTQDVKYTFSCCGFKNE
jgi:hypothetical protein